MSVRKVYEQPAPPPKLAAVHVDGRGDSKLYVAWSHRTPLSVVMFDAQAPGRGTNRIVVHWADAQEFADALREMVGPAVTVPRITAAREREAVALRAARGVRYWASMPPSDYADAIARAVLAAVDEIAS